MRGKMGILVGIIDSFLKEKGNWSLSTKQISNDYMIWLSFGLLTLKKI